jgi:riboflavin kinase/FMN adenylyltransferase
LAAFADDTLSTLPMTSPSNPAIPAAATAKGFAVLRGDGDVPAWARGGVLAIGNFDGVHRGHRAVIDAALARAGAEGRHALALTFEPHPRAFFRADEKMFRLTDEAAKLRLLAAAGMDGGIVLPFDSRLASLTAEEFVANVLVERLGVAGVAVGFDFHFGRGRQGSPAFLTAEGAKRGFTVDVAPPLEDEGRPVSSSAIRAALAEGRVVEAAELLGYPWFVSGEVIAGEKRGRDLGYPTANIRLDPACGLKHGIYAVRVGVDGKRRDGVASFGRRPTFDNGAPLLEVFLFDFSEDLYGKTLDVAFMGWIRPELKFDSAEALVARMNEDCRLARAALARAPGAFPPI